MRFAHLLLSLPLLAQQGSAPPCTHSTGLTAEQIKEVCEHGSKAYIGTAQSVTVPPEPHVTSEMREAYQQARADLLDLMVQAVTIRDKTEEARKRMDAAASVMIKACAPAPLKQNEQGKIDCDRPTVAPAKPEVKQ